MNQMVFIETIEEPDEPPILIAHIVNAEFEQLCTCDTGWEGIRVRPTRPLTKELIRDDGVSPCEDTLKIATGTLKALRFWQGLTEGQTRLLQELSFQEGMG